MKNTPFLKAGIAMLCLFSSTLSFAVDGGSIMGRVTDPETNTPVDGAAVVFDCQGNQIVYYTDANGYYYASNISPCNYTIIVSYMSKRDTAGTIRLAADETKTQDLAFSSTLDIPDIVIDGEPLVNPVSVGHFLPAKELEKMPILKVSDAIILESGVVEMDGNYFVRGSRDGALAFYIDGCKVTGNPNVPISGVSSIRTYVGYVPAKYGDTIGGIFAIETRNYFSR